MTGNMNRRVWLGLTAGSALSLGLAQSGGAQECCSPKKMDKEAAGCWKSPKNEQFYKKGIFDPDTAKTAYYAMMEQLGYPIVDRLRSDEFWTLDFGLRIFAEVGMAGIFWVNNQEHNYMGHEIYLLPGQMIPEHWHEATETAGPKLEAWHVRYGQVTLYAEGEPTPGSEDRIPKSHKKIAKARKEQVVLPGQIGYLAHPRERHFMVAGPGGAIVTEYATYHDMAGLRFTHPGIRL